MACSLLLIRNKIVTASEYITCSANCQGAGLKHISAVLPNHAGSSSQRNILRRRSTEEVRQLACNRYSVQGKVEPGGIHMATDKTGGLAGIIAGNTSIATVGKEGKGLTYRGYSIYDLAEHSTFEEVAYLLIYGRLPTLSELSLYKNTLGGLRGLPAPLKTVLEQIPGNTPPMDVMRTGCSMLGTLEPEGAARDQIAVANRLTACFSSMLLYWYQFQKSGQRIETATDDDSTA